MRAAGLLAEMPDVQFVLGVKNAMPADRTAFDCCIETTARLMLDAEWCAAGTGRDQLTVNKRYVAAGGHARTGLEENVLLDHDTPAPSNAALVRRVTELCERYERPAASWR